LGSVPSTKKKKQFNELIFTNIKYLGARKDVVKWEPLYTVGGNAN
jgi:hypothetical protein